MYGVELHANVIQQILDNNHLYSNLSFQGINTNMNDKIMSRFIKSVPLEMGLMARV